MIFKLLTCAVIACNVGPVGPTGASGASGRGINAMHSTTIKGVLKPSEGGRYLIMNDRTTQGATVVNEDLAPMNAATLSQENATNWLNAFDKTWRGDKDFVVVEKHPWFNSSDFIVKESEGLSLDSPAPYTIASGKDDEDSSFMVIKKHDGATIYVRVNGTPDNKMNEVVRGFLTGLGE